MFCHSLEIFCFTQVSNSFLLSPTVSHCLWFRDVVTDRAVGKQLHKELNKFTRKLLRGFTCCWRDASIFMYVYQLVTIRLFGSFCSVKDRRQFGPVSCAYLSQFSGIRFMHCRADKPHAWS